MAEDDAAEPPGEAPTRSKDALSAAVFATPVTRAVFLGVAAGEQDLARIVSKNRLLRPAAERAVKDFASRGLVEPAGEGKWKLTPAGEALRVEIQRKYL